MGLLTQTAEQYYDSGIYGGYQFTSLNNIINQFMVAYVGEDKIISKAKRVDVAFHAQRALQELSFDVFKSCKSEEIVVPATLQMILPRDYVNYTKISWVDSAGIKHLMYPTSKTSNPSVRPYQDEDGEFSLTPVGTLTSGSNVVVLDGDYSGVLVNGMKVEDIVFNPNKLANNSYINDISTTAGITSITLKNKAGTVNKNATGTGDFELKITNFGLYESATDLTGSFVKGGKTVVETTTAATTPIGGYNITVTSTEGIKKGMFVNHPDLSNNTSAFKVVGVSDSVVSISQAATRAIANGTTISFISDSDSTTWENYKSVTPSENQDDYIDDTYWPMDGNRYGLDPQHAQANGSFYIDCHTGKIHFSSNVSGKTVVLDYISDSLGTDAEMQVHKFAEEAMYKWIAYAILSTRANIQEYIVRRYKKEKFAETRKAKLRLSNIKLEEITQILRGKSKQIKH